MMESTNLVNTFHTPEYTKFKEFVVKSANDGSLKIQNNHVEYGKQRTVIPAFLEAEALKEELENQRIALLMKYSDVYDKIVLTDQPILYRKQYESIVESIEQVDRQLDELTSFVQSMQEEKVGVPVQKLEEQLDMQRIQARNITEGLKGAIHIPQKKVQELAKLHKEVMTTQAKLDQAQLYPGVPYVIWKKSSAGLQESATKQVKKSKVASAKSSGRLSEAKKTAIKASAKQVMVDKLG